MDWDSVRIRYHAWAGVQGRAVESLRRNSFWISVADWVIMRLTAAGAFVSILSYFLKII